MPDDIEPTSPSDSPPPGGGSTPLYAANEKISKVNVSDEIKNSFLDAQLGLE